MSLPVSADYSDESAVDGQAGSALFSVPLEVRRAVCGHLFDLAGQHILHHVGNDGTHQFKLTPCTAPCIVPAVFNGKNHCGQERRCFDSDDSSPVYKRRLASTWGPHWLCEELAFRWKHEHYPEEAENKLSESSHNLSYLLRVCKRMYVSPT